MVPSRFTTALPWSGRTVTVTVAGLIVVPAAAVSFARTLTVLPASGSALFAIIAKSSGFVTGATATKFTVTVTVAMFETAPVVSMTTYWNESTPKKLRFGLYVT